MTTQPEYARELETRSGKCKSPTLDIDGAVLADTSIEDVAKVLEQAGIEI